MDSLSARSAPKVIISDIDGTLLNSRERVTQRLREVIGRAIADGGLFTLASGRPPRWMIPVLEQLLVRPVCICANGAVIYDSARDEIVHSWTLEPDQLHHIADVALAATSGFPSHVTGGHAGGVGFGAERAGHSAFDRADELYVVEEKFTHAWESDEHAILTADEVLSAPAVKLLIRNPNVSSMELYEAIAPHLDPEIGHISYSWDGGLVEISPAGVSKRTAIDWVLEEYSDHLTAEDCIAFGDMPNDIEMLKWVGIGVAMGNADDAVKKTADVVTDTCDNDGVAKILETWF